MYYFFHAIVPLWHTFVYVSFLSVLEMTFFIFIGTHTNIEKHEDKYFNSGPVIKTSPDLYFQIPYATSNSGTNLKSVII